jgi:4-amino-4-deoxychorismate lyase
VTTCGYRLPLNPVLAGIKHLNRLDQVMARAEWAEEYDDGIMFSTHDRAIETTRANLFVKLASGWVTPRLDQAGVRGVMRELLLDQLFSRAGLKVRQGEVSPEQLDSAEELFSCSSVRGIVPIVAIRKDAADLAIGEDTRALQSRLQDYCGGFSC